MWLRRMLQQKVMRAPINNTTTNDADDLQIELTSAKLRYLLAIAQLSGVQSPIRSADIASLLQVSRPSVHKMLNELCDSGLTSKGSYSRVTLTHKGAALALRYQQQYDRISSALSLKLALGEPDARIAALALMDTLSEDALQGFS